MRKFPKPWFRPKRGLWYVTLNGRQVNLGPDKEAAFEQYKQLLAEPNNYNSASDFIAADRIKELYGIDPTSS
ncbi:hypothetical protein [Blastopirellula retiformator]|uniref:Uncharacterized protein n=1 Tax=Blastopirellula retiformator TaxID=2527970 RepID=A0A5C5V784_9BACT|nr:hypothetical protein [Blastopirellula retiformator]TWT34444.1 hypothetical protein Enr8_18520 [Blastopirellula retiformator]